MMAVGGQAAGRQTALVTGASRGIGYELAKLLARDGYDLVLVARNEQELNQLGEEMKREYGTAVTVMAKDLSVATAPKEVFEEVERRGIRVDVLVNNAGFGTIGPFVRQALDGQLRMVQVNVTALVHLTGLFLPEMVARGTGRILNVASTAAFQPGPLMAVYYASKAFVLSFSEALWEEARGTGVKVSCLCPGSTVSKFREVAGTNKVRLSRAGAQMPSMTVARMGYGAWQSNKRVEVTGARNRAIASVVRFLPRTTLLRLVRNIQSPI